MVDQGRVVTPPVLNVLLLLSPTDLYRLLNLTTSADVRRPSPAWPASTESASLGPAVLLAALVAWMLLPLALASAIFARRDL